MLVTVGRIMLKYHGDVVVDCDEFREARDGEVECLLVSLRWARRGFQPR